MLDKAVARGEAERLAADEPVSFPGRRDGCAHGHAALARDAGIACRWPARRPAKRCAVIDRARHMGRQQTGGLVRHRPTCRLPATPRYGGRVVRRLLAALWLGLGLGLTLAGLPVVLVALFGVPLPRHPPQQPYLREWISSAAVLLLWLVWLVLLAMVGLHLRDPAVVAATTAALTQLPEGLLAGLVSAVVVAATTAGS